MGSDFNNGQVDIVTQDSLPYDNREDQEKERRKVEDDEDNEEFELLV